MSDKFVSNNKQKAEITGEGNLTPLEKWVQQDPSYRSQEIDYIKSLVFEHQPQVTKDGDVQQVVTIKEWTFLLVLHRTFPSRAEDADLPIKIYLVAPNGQELAELLSGQELSHVQKDDAGSDYLLFSDFQQDYDAYMAGRLSSPLTELLISNTYTWVKTIHKKKIAVNLKRAFKPFSRLFKHPEVDYLDTCDRQEKYIDGRQSVTGKINVNCKKVVLSDRAYIQIFNETQSRITTETGGLLLGHYEDGVWYVVEASDPGINAVFHQTYHEGDDVYENHVCGVISRTYKYPLVFLGMWHRHPGSFDRFSSTDDSTNFKYAGSVGNGCISALINYDPEFRITFYYAEQGKHQPIYYTKVDIEVGDDKFPNPELLKVATMEDVIQRQG